MTGATGFIGQHLQRALVSHGYQLCALVRPGSSRRHRLRADCEATPVELDDLDALKSAVAGAGAVIYCAGTVRGRSPEDFEPANVTGVKTLVAAISSLAELPPFLLISSLAAARPDLSPYSASKYGGEQALSGCSDIPWTIIRPPAVYGPGDRELRPLLNLARRGFALQFGRKEQRFALLHVDDLAAAVLAWLEAWPRCRGRVFAIDDGHAAGYEPSAISRAARARRQVTLRLPGWLLQAAARTNVALAAVLGHAPMLTPGKVRELCQSQWLCDNTEFSRATGWEPSVGLERGLQALFGTAVPGPA